MAEPVKPKRRPRGYLWIGAGALIFAVMFYFYQFYPRQLVGPEQPIFFSHRIHAGVKAINCRFCHPFVERSQHAGLPPVEKCFFCHQYVIPNHPEIQRERGYFEANRPVPWKRVFYVPDFVFFSHRPHIEWAGFDCSRCHGDVRSVDRLRTTKFQMGFCITCHRENGGKIVEPARGQVGPPAMLDCWLACHR